MTFLPTPIPATRTTVPTVTTTPTPRMTPTPIDPIGVKESELKGIEIEVWHGWGSPQKELLEAQIADFNRKNAWDITVSARAFQDWASLYEAVNQNIEFTILA